jgi:uncharacterized protein (TIGR02147 family)
MNIFKCLEYRDILEEKIHQYNEKRGYLTQLALAAHCQKSYLTLVRQKKVHFTLEHGMALCEYWEFSDLETDYFLELINFERAGLSSLKEKIRKRLVQLRKSNEDLSQRFAQPKPQNSTVELAYYGNWYMSAIHVMVNIPRFQMAPSIAVHLGLPTDTVKRGLEKLLELGFVKFVDGRWLPGHGSLHLPRESPATSMNHQNWRMRAILDSHNDESNGLHYTAVQTLKVSDFEKIKEMIQQFLDHQRKIVVDSPEEELAVLCFDWFQL